MPLVNDNVKWDEMGDVHSSTLKGYDARSMMVQELKRWDPSYIYGTTTEEEMPIWLGEGWQNLKIEHFGAKSVKAFNEDTALRHNIVPDSSGFVRWRKTYIMFMKRSRYILLMAQRNQVTEEDFKKSLAETEEQAKERADKIRVNRQLSKREVATEAGLTVEETTVGEFAGLD